MARSSPVPHRELRRLDILECPDEERFDRVTRLARRAFGVQAAVFLLHDGDRAWIRSSSGLGHDSPVDATFSRHVARFADALVVDDASRDARFSHTPLVAGGPRFRFCAGFPVRSPQGDPLGTLCVFDARPRMFTASDSEILRDLALLLEDLVRSTGMANDHFELLREREELRGRALVDPLTRVWNRAAIAELVRVELERSRREGTPLGLLLVDLDRFKEINDLHGHDAGDAVLREAATRMRSVLREYDALGRWGGEEFLVVLPNAWLRQALELGEKLRSVVGGRPVEVAGGRALLTVSVGVAAGKERKIDELITEAERAMIRAKKKGRDRVEQGNGK